MSWSPATLSAMSTSAQRAHWRQRATWLAQLGLDPDEAVPAALAEELGDRRLSHSRRSCASTPGADNRSARGSSSPSAHVM
jgi:hypothetical protein